MQQARQHQVGTPRDLPANRSDQQCHFQGMACRVSGAPAANGPGREAPELVCKESGGGLQVAPEGRPAPHGARPANRRIPAEPGGKAAESVPDLQADDAVGLGPGREVGKQRVNNRYRLNPGTL